MSSLLHEQLEKELTREIAHLQKCSGMTAKVQAEVILILSQAYRNLQPTLKNLPRPENQLSN